MDFNILNRLKYLFFNVHNGWEIGVVKSPLKDIVNNKSISDTKWFTPPKNVIWADPFGVKIGDKYYIFYEEKEEGKYGVINCMVLNSELGLLSNKTIIDENLHFSFPHFFQFENKYYLLPETHEKERLSLYVCENFPHDWMEETTLLNVRCVDSSLFNYNGYWYLFYQKIGHGCNLFMRVNRNLKNGWEECDETMVNSNPYNAQNAGCIVEIDGVLYRFSQNASRMYGESIVINRIESLSPEKFQESIYHEISLKKGRVSCCHTLNNFGEYTLIDRRRERLYLKSIEEFILSFKNKLFSN